MAYLNMKAETEEKVGRLENTYPFKIISAGTDCNIG